MISPAIFVTFGGFPGVDMCSIIVPMNQQQQQQQQQRQQQQQQLICSRLIPKKVPSESPRVQVPAQGPAQPAQCPSPSPTPGGLILDKMNFRETFVFVWFRNIRFHLRLQKPIFKKTHFCTTVYFCMVPETQIPFALTKISIPKKTFSQNPVFLYGFRTLDFICAYKNNGFEKHVFVKPYVFHTF